MKHNKKRRKGELIRLKPCPFCGSTKIEKGHTTGIDGPFTWISCRKCGASSAIKGTVLDAIAVWNLRVYPR